MSVQYIIPILELAQHSQLRVHFVARAIHVRCPPGVSLPKYQTKQKTYVLSSMALISQRNLTISSFEP